MFFCNAYNCADDKTLKELQDVILSFEKEGKILLFPMFKVKEVACLREYFNKNGSDADKESWNNLLKNLPNEDPIGFFLNNSARLK